MNRKVLIASARAAQRNGLALNAASLAGALLQEYGDAFEAFRRCPVTTASERLAQSYLIRLMRYEAAA